ncbi:hypothetical protein H0H81_005466, partial [Sphagnurus paluster]
MDLASEFQHAEPSAPIKKKGTPSAAATSTEKGASTTERPASSHGEGKLAKTLYVDREVRGRRVIAHSTVAEIAGSLSVDTKPKVKVGPTSKKRTTRASIAANEKTSESEAEVTKRTTRGKGKGRAAPIQKTKKARATAAASKFAPGSESEGDHVVEASEVKKAGRKKTPGNAIRAEALITQARVAESRTPTTYTSILEMKEGDFFPHPCERCTKGFRNCVRQKRDLARTCAACAVSKLTCELAELHPRGFFDRSRGVKVKKEQVSDGDSAHRMVRRSWSESIPDNANRSSLRLRGPSLKPAARRRDEDQDDGTDGMEEEAEKAMGMEEDEECIDEPAGKDMQSSPDYQRFNADRVFHFKSTARQSPDTAQFKGQNPSMINRWAVNMGKGKGRAISPDEALVTVKKRTSRRPHKHLSLLLTFF